MQMVMSYEMETEQWVSTVIDEGRSEDLGKMIHTLVRVPEKE